MNLWFTLHMDLTNEEGPGWYLSATRQDGPEDVAPDKRAAIMPVQLIEPTRLSSMAVKAVSMEMDVALPEGLAVAPSQIVSSGVHLIQEAITRELKRAEDAAVRAAKLKALQDAESPTDKDVESNDL